MPTMETIRSVVDGLKATYALRTVNIFGSYAEGRATPQSDLDLLVDYDKTAKLSLLDAVRFKLDLERIIGREVDMIENGSLKPFAVPSAEHDKYLIYER